MENQKSPSVTPETMDVRSMIHEIKGQQVMLDRDLAVLYGVEVKQLNRQVKRNLERFPPDFMFQLTREDCLRCQIGTLKGKRGEHLKYLPYAFTENGIAMLSSVLRSPAAIGVNIRIMRTFVALRDALLRVEPMKVRLDAVESRQIADQLRNETRFDELFSKMSGSEVPEYQVFYQGKFWEAKSLLVKLIRQAKQDLVVIDAYLDVATLDLLAKRGRGVKIELVTHSNGELAESDFEAFGQQFGNLTKTFCGICHDRFIIVDRREIYLIGASLKDAGRLTFAISKMGSEVIPGLLDTIARAASASVKYS